MTGIVPSYDPYIAAKIEVMAAGPVIPVHFVTISADADMVTRPVLLCGWSFRETSGSAAAGFKLVNGSQQSAPTVYEINLAAGATDHEVCMDPGIWCEGGIFIHFRTGTISGALHIRL